MRAIVQRTGRLLVLALGPGELLLESIVAASRRHRIANGVVVSGIGTLKNCHLHAITGTGFPPKNRNFARRKPLELLTVSGIIADYEPHLHVVVSWLDRQTWCGHLHEKSEVAYLAEVAILALSGPRMRRRLDPERAISDGADGAAAWRADPTRNRAIFRVVAVVSRDCNSL
jgi:predicted DNA-binding protein with PD1-like motif